MSGYGSRIAYHAQDADCFEVEESAFEEVVHGV